MIQFERIILNNGLTVLLHKDEFTDIAAVNILYNVGARDEDENNTGFAHLFEHLMFGGSKNIPQYDTPLQDVGGENNAFTSNDITNYYLTLPVNNLETAFWLESDRMLELNFSDKSLAVQKNVVMEEFKQSYLNQPYGDVWAILRKLAYKKHPYKWQTIGKSLKHIQNATLEDVKSFFYTFYRPNNAILAVAGNIDFDKTIKMIEKWFGDIPSGNIKPRELPQEPLQRKARFKEVHREVPASKIYKVFHTCNRVHKHYHAVDLMSDILSNGKSSRLYTNLLKKQKLFSSINAYITGSMDNNLFVIEGTLSEGISMTKAENAINREIDSLCKGLVSKKELVKVKNKVATLMEMGLQNVDNKAMYLCVNELIDGNTATQNELQNYFNVSENDILQMAQNYLRPSNCSTLYYLKKN